MLNILVFLHNTESTSFPFPGGSILQLRISGWIPLWRKYFILFFLHFQNKCLRIQCSIYSENNRIFLFNYLLFCLENEESQLKIKGSNLCHFSICGISKKNLLFFSLPKTNSCLHFQMHMPTIYWQDLWEEKHKLSYERGREVRVLLVQI